MAKLYYRYGTVSSAKTLNLLAVAENYRIQGRAVLLIKPKLDTRFGLRIIKSKVGLESAADILLSSEEGVFLSGDGNGIPHTDRENGSSFLHLTSLEVFQHPTDLFCVLVDEAQFLSPVHIEELREIATSHGIPVICYGLRTDFRSRLFPASKRLFELADSIEEIKTTCYYCGHCKATLSLKHVDGVASLEGPAIQLGCEETYHPACFKCYKEKIILSNPKSYAKRTETHSYLVFPDEL
ncbi:hypothetical protein MDAP_000561 [Mitosporidium daphniae]|uniref:Thymidine kinase n=1 Tax=Mitosporidium daphniae TaxID=1485682 RepID=A0A098VM20_9MICR|nr:thymidine kinase [Mitosporidium daphniae]KGG50118.1 thymidine kinase [Mitosporidium daphniae]|eukprot:XP_013236554.1 thymidine kinase [Mitosporidium daphniae]